MFSDSADFFPASQDFLSFWERSPCHAGDAPGRNARHAPCPSRHAPGRTGAGAAHLTDDSQTVRKKVQERGGVVSKKVSSASWPAVARASRRLPRELPETGAPLSSRKQPRRRGRTHGPPRMECFWTVTCHTPPPASWAVPMAAEPIVGHRGPCVARPPKGAAWDLRAPLFHKTTP